MSIDNNDTKALTACKMPAQSLPPLPFFIYRRTTKQAVVWL